MIVYVVKVGDTLSNIAYSYQVTMQAIQQINQLPNPNKLLVGQAIIIPIPGTYHTVSSGETLSSIAQTYGISVDSMIKANRIIDENKLSVGNRLYVPPIVHVVQAGQTLEQIAKLYNTTTQAIIDKNHLTIPNRLYIGASLIIPRPKPEIEVNGYTYERDKDAAESIAEHGPLLTYLSPFAYKLTENGNLEPFPDKLMLEEARNEHITPLLVITNFTSTEKGSNLMHVIFSSKVLQDKILNEAEELMKEKGYKGLNIDFENVLPEDREAYNSFLQLAVDRLHPLGYSVSTALAPKYRSDQPGLLYEAHDYKTHGEIVNFIILMTYEWGWRGAPPQAISPITEMRKVVEYALSEVPANKLFLGFQIYARDWKIPFEQGQYAETFSPQEAIRLATIYNVAIQYDTVAEAPYFHYTDESGQQHEVWFEDARSAQAKFQMVKEYNLRGISYWALGYPYPQNWALLYDNFTVKKMR